jgi:hypothetical protein
VRRERGSPAEGSRAQSPRRVVNSRASAMPARGLDRATAPEPSRGATRCLVPRVRRVADEGLAAAPCAAPATANLSPHADEVDGGSRHDGHSRLQLDAPAASRPGGDGRHERGDYPSASPRRRSRSRASRRRFARSATSGSGVEPALVRRRHGGRRSRHPVQDGDHTWVLFGDALAPDAPPLKPSPTGCVAELRDVYARPRCCIRQSVTPFAPLPPTRTRRSTSSPRRPSRSACSSRGAASRARAPAARGTSRRPTSRCRRARRRGGPTS